MGSQRVRHNWASFTFPFCLHIFSNFDHCRTCWLNLDNQKGPGIIFFFFIIPIKLSHTSLKSIYVLLIRGVILQIQGILIISEMHIKSCAIIQCSLTLKPSVDNIFSQQKKQMECSLQYLLAFVPIAATLVFYDVFLHRTFSFQHHAISLTRTQQKGQLSYVTFSGSQPSSWKSTLKMLGGWHFHLSTEAFKGAMCLPVGRRWMVFSPLRPGGLAEDTTL